MRWAEPGAGGPGSAPRKPERRGPGAGKLAEWLRRALGALLVALALLPGSAILDPSRIGPFGQWVMEMEAQAMDLMLWGSVIAVGVGVVHATLSDGTGLRSLLERAGRGLTRVAPWPFALACGVVSAGLAALALHGLVQGLPTNVDSIASLLQGRFMARGMTAGPAPEPRASWIILNTLVTDGGWVSFYPPLHTALLATGLLAGAPFLVGPILTGVAVAAATRLALDALPHRPAVARLGGLLAVASPFLVFVGGGYLSHTSTAAGIAVAAWTTHRATRGGWGWAVAAGAATGFAVSSRPWTGMVVCGGILSVLWLGRLRRREGGAAWLASRAVAAGAGGLPFALSLLSYNAHFFGHPLRLGYEVAYGPAHGLGFHADPWGFPYGWTEALGYTAADLGSLSLQLLETPIPAVAVVGLYLATARRIEPGTRPFLLWALLPVVANVFYWHHGFHLGPRMLFEAAPAWCVLLAISGVELAGAGATRRPGGVEPSPATAYLRRAILATFCVALLGPLFLVPARLNSHALAPEERSRMVAPSPPSEPALVFVHGSWSERISARLQASGMRLDSLEVALRRNDLCRVDAYAQARREGRNPPALDFRMEPGMPEGLEAVEVPGGTTVRRNPDAPLRRACLREMRADRMGTVPLAPLLWQGDLPGVETGRPVFVRDLGPEENRRVLERFPDRSAFLYHSPGPGQPATLRPYGEGSHLLWGEVEGRP